VIGVNFHNLKKSYSICQVFNFFKSQVTNEKVISWSVCPWLDLLVYHGICQLSDAPVLFRLLALFANIRLGYKSLPGANDVSLSEEKNVS
jgi:hypothetical protein